MDSPIYLELEQLSQLEDIVTDYGDTLKAVFEHIALEYMRQSRDSTLSARNQAAAAEAGISKAFETAFDSIAAELEEQKAQHRLRELENQIREGESAG